MNKHSEGRGMPDLSWMLSGMEMGQPSGWHERSEIKGVNKA